MIQTRISRPGDIPAQRELWKLAFGDDGAYVDNFYQSYYRPERVLVLEEDGVVRAMTAWFDTSFAMPGRPSLRAAYLYAVATHPDCRGRGLAGKLLAGADDYFRGLGIPAVTTVPAEPSLHKFFGANGFWECFVLAQTQLFPGDLGPVREDCLRPVTPREYGKVRERLLSHMPHISYPEDALAYQAGCCALSGGGLYCGTTRWGSVCLCAEGGEGGLMVIKEVLGSPQSRAIALDQLPQVAPGARWLVRKPLSPGDEGWEKWPFAMLKLLNCHLEEGWDWPTDAYLGLAFD